MRKTSLRIRAALLACLCLGAGTAMAEDAYPTRPIQIIVPFAAAGSIDITFRVLAPVLGKLLGQSVVVVDRPGGMATIGMNQVAKAPADGYMLGAASFSFAVDPALLESMPYDPQKDFEPITMVSRSPTLLLVNPNVPAKTVSEFIAWAKTQPAGSINYGSVGVGSSGHMFGALFASRAGIKMTHVPFTNNAFGEVAQGLDQMMFGPIPSSMPFVKDGRLRPLAVTSLQPDPSMPDLPTISKDLPGFEAFEWPSLVAPKGTPRPVIDKIQKAVVESLKDPDVKKRLADLGSQPVGSTPEELQKFIGEQVNIWAKVVKDIGLTPTKPE